MKEAAIKIANIKTKPDYQLFSVKTRSLFGIGGVLRET
jgi:hypothetical protein